MIFNTASSFWFSLNCSLVEDGVKLDRDRWMPSWNEALVVITPISIDLFFILNLLYITDDARTDDRLMQNQSKSFKLPRVTLFDKATDIAKSLNHRKYKFIKNKCFCQMKLWMKICICLFIKFHWWQILTEVGQQRCVFHPCRISCSCFCPPQKCTPQENWRHFLIIMKK